jgi:hypothetical protein
LDKDGNQIETFGWRTIAQGAATIIAAAFDPSIVSQNGAYLIDCLVANDALSTDAQNEALADKLWEVCEKLSGQKFEL